MRDKTSHLTETGRGYVQRSCQSTRVWQRYLVEFTQCWRRYLSENSSFYVSYSYPFVAVQYPLSNWLTLCTLNMRVTLVALDSRLSFTLIASSLLTYLLTYLSAVDA